MSEQKEAVTEERVRFMRCLAAANIEEGIVSIVPSADLHEVCNELLAARQALAQMQSRADTYEGECRRLERLIADEEVRRLGQIGSLQDSRDAALAELARVREQSAKVDDLLLCGRDDGAHFCGKCDNSLWVDRLHNPKASP